jgi:hypothetical protein
MREMTRGDVMATVLIFIFILGVPTGVLYWLKGFQIAMLAVLVLGFTINAVAVLSLER